MKIHNIKITNFKSLYGTHEINFDELTGMVKFCGPVGAGKTTLAEAIIWGLYGNVSERTISNLKSWNAKCCEVEMFLDSKGKQVHIIRNSNQPLIVEIDGHTIASSSKNDMQDILENEVYDIPKLAVTRVCVISFNAFNSSLAAMTPSDTKKFLDDVFGFQLLTDYSVEVTAKKKAASNEIIKLQAIYDETNKQIQRLEEKKLAQQREINNSIDTKALGEERQRYVDEGVEQKKAKQALQTELDTKVRELQEQINSFYKAMTEAATLGREAKRNFELFGSGICPTCGQEIDAAHIEQYKSDIEKYAAMYRENEAEKKKIEQARSELQTEYQARFKVFDDKMIELKEKIYGIDNQIRIFNNNIRLINENFDELINENKRKADETKAELEMGEKAVNEWNEMLELFTKTFRYNLLERIIPNINKSIQYFINRMEMPYIVKYDQEFKLHIFIDTYDNEISYKGNLSTGQRKIVDVAIVFGILHNVISNVDLNVLVLDELMSNMNADVRNTMLSLLSETMSEDKSVFVINHAEMDDNFFAHKINVRMNNKKFHSDIKGVGDVIVKSSTYEKVF